MCASYYRYVHTFSIGYLHSEKADAVITHLLSCFAIMSLTSRTREATPPTWGQMKKLTQEAEKTLVKAGQPLNPTNLLLAMMAVATCQVIGVSASNHTYWAYIPNPPLVRAVSWGEPEVQVCTSETAFFPRQPAGE